MNFTTNNNSTILDQFSVTTLRSQRPAYFLWLLLGSVNLVSAIVTIIIFAIWKPFHKDTLLLAINLSLAEAGVSISNMMLAIYHLRNAYLQISEVTSQAKCYPLVVWQPLFLISIALFYLIISFDRFWASIYPNSYKDRSDLYGPVATIIIWLITFFCTFLTALGISDAIVDICIARIVVKDGFVKYITLMILTLSIVSVSVYVSSVLILKRQIKKVANDGSSVAEIGNRMRNKATRSLAINCLFHFFSYTLSSMGSAAVSIFSNQADVIGPYFNILYNVGAISSLVVYCVCQQKFYDGVKSFLKCKFVANQQTKVTMFSVSANGTASQARRNTVSTTITHM